MSSLTDATRVLTRVLKESTEVKSFTAAKAKVSRDKQADKLIQEFRQRQLELQTQQMQGKQVTPQQVQALEQLFTRLAQMPVLQEYMQAEQRLGQVIAELNRSILEACGIEVAQPPTQAAAPVKH